MNQLRKNTSVSKSIPKRQHTVNTRSKEQPRTPAGDAVSHLIVQVLQLNGLLTAAGDALAAPAGQTSARWQVLAAVEDAPLAVAQIARAMNLARQSVQRVADLLVQERLAVYEDNPAHLRAKLLQLTPRGRAALKTIQAAQRLWAEGLAAGIGEAKLRAASSVLGELQQVLGAQNTAQNE